MAGFQIKAEFKGLAPLIDKLGGLKATVRRKVLRSAVRKSVSLINKSAKQSAPVGPTKALKKSYGVKVKVYPSGIVIGVVEPRAGFRVPIGKGGKVRYHDPRRIAHLAERGTAARRHKSGKSTGAAKAKPHLQPAITANDAKVTAIFGEEIDKALAEVAR